MIIIEDMSVQLGFGTAPRAHRQPRKARPPKVDSMTSRAIQTYSDAYRAVYNVRPRITVAGKWIRIHGHDAGVSRKRLLEMATQLRYRAGVC